jgi:adenosylcobyric acid synthase
VRGALLVAGTASNAGKSVVVAGLCRWLARAGTKVTPFKAQNMALNSAVTADGSEIGRAQAMQAAAAGIEPEAAMNPVLLKPSGERTSQVVVLGRALGEAGARDYQEWRPRLLPVVLDALAELRGRFDVVVCEGAGSPAEMNLRAGDLANMGLARAAGMATVVVGGIDRGGVLAALYGTVALLDPADQRLVAGFLVNKFRGDPGILAPGLARLQALSGRPTLGVLPWRHGVELDGEDSLTLPAQPSPPPDGADTLDVAVVRLRRLSNHTDLDPLAAEPGVSVRFTRRAADVVGADLAVLPGTKATVDDLRLVRESGIAAALTERARRGDPTMGICGGYQMLGRKITDAVESGAGTVAGLGLLPVDTVFGQEKVLGRRAGRSTALAEAPVSGYEIRHGRVTVHAGRPLLTADGGGDEGCVVGSVIGTSWHGLLEADGFRRALLAWVAERRGLDFSPGDVSFAELRECRLDRLGDLVEHHADTAALGALIEHGAPSGLPTVRCGVAS